MNRKLTHALVGIVTAALGAGTASAAPLRDELQILQLEDRRAPVVSLIPYLESTQAETRARACLAVGRIAGPAEVERTAHTVIWTQTLRHPRLRWASRTLEVWKGKPRARLTVKLYRISSDDPEIIHIVSPLPCGGAVPTVSCGGDPFVPFRDQLPGSCRDHFAIDGWAWAATDAGSWIWATLDAPLVTFGRPSALERRLDPPPDADRILAIAFDNFWYTNFVGDAHGAMEFRFDLEWRPKVAGPAEAADIAEAIAAEPAAAIVPGLPEDPVMLERLWR